MNDATRVTTGEVRMSYVHLFKPYAFQPGQEEKYSVTVLVPKTDAETMGRINAAVEAARQRGMQDKWGGVLPPVCPVPVYDGDGTRPSDGMPFGPECKGCWVFTASAKADYPPQVVDSQGNPIINQSEVYSGMYGRVNINFFPYAFGGKKGIGCGLGPVMKTKDGEPLGGGAPSAAEAFGLTQQTGYPAGQAAGYSQPAAGYISAPANAAPAYAPPAYQTPVQPDAHRTAGVNPVTGLPF